MKELFEKLKMSNKEEFQDTFSKIMKKIYKDSYQPVQSYGNIGDRKVDGILNHDTVYAVYAPEVYKESEVISKIKSDFTGFIEHKDNGNWPSSITNLVFVVKSNREKGATPNLVNLVMELKEEYEIEIRIWTLDDILELIEHKFVPEIPFEAISSLSSNITNLKKMYAYLRKDFIDLDRNSNSLFHYSEESNNIQRMNYFISVLNINTEIALSRDKYFLHFNKMKIGKKLDALIELCPPFSNDLISLPDAFESVANDEKYKVRKKLCNKLLRKLSEIV